MGGGPDSHINFAGRANFPDPHSPKPNLRITVWKWAISRWVGGRGGIAQIEQRPSDICYMYVGNPPKHYARLRYSPSAVNFYGLKKDISHISSICIAYRLYVSHIIYMYYMYVGNCQIIADCPGDRLMAYFFTDAEKRYTNYSDYMYRVSIICIICMSPISKSFQIGMVVD